MPETISVSKPEELKETIEKALSKNPSVLLIYLFGDEEEETGQSWCPDCRDADPWVRTAMSKKEDSILVEVRVGDRRSYKGVPDNPYRLHEYTQVKSIPTLIRWGSAGPEGRLDENSVTEKSVCELCFTFMKKRKWDVPQPNIEAATSIATDVNAPAIPLAIIDDPVALAQRKAQLINQMLKMKKGDVQDSNVASSVLAAPLFSGSFEINDLLPHIRYKLTKGETQKLIAQETGAAVTSKGMYKAAGSELPPGEKPIHLFITADNQEAIEKAKRKIQEIISGSQAPTNALPTLASQFGSVSSATGQEPFVEKVYVGPAESDIRVRSKILGEKGANVKYIASHCNVRVILRGRGTVGRGGDPNESLHLWIAGNNETNVQQAKNLAASLINSTIRDLMIHTPVPPQPISQPMVMQPMQMQQGYHQQPTHHQLQSQIPSNSGKPLYAAVPPPKSLDFDDNAPPPPPPLPEEDLSTPQPPSHPLVQTKQAGHMQFYSAQQLPIMQPMQPVPYMMPSFPVNPYAPPFPQQTFMQQSWNVPYNNQFNQSNFVHPSTLAGYDNVNFQNTGQPNHTPEQKHDAVGPQLPKVGERYEVLPEVSGREVRPNPFSEENVEEEEEEEEDKPQPGKVRSKRPLVPAYQTDPRPSKALKGSDTPAASAAQSGPTSSKPFWLYQPPDDDNSPIDFNSSKLDEDKEEKYKNLMRELGIRR